MNPEPTHEAFGFRLSQVAAALPAEKCSTSPTLKKTINGGCNAMKIIALQCSITEALKEFGMRFISDFKFKLQMNPHSMKFILFSHRLLSASTYSLCLLPVNLRCFVDIVRLKFCETSS